MSLTQQPSAPEAKSPADDPVAAVAWAAPVARAGARVTGRYPRVRTGALPSPTPDAPYSWAEARASALCPLCTCGRSGARHRANALGPACQDPGCVCHDPWEAVA